MGKDATRNAYGRALEDLAKDHDNIVVLDADLSGSTKSGSIKKVRPDRHFNMGIAESNMMGVAAGLAASGKLVFASSFAMFAVERAFEQIRNSIAYPKLNVKICASHAGITVGEDGASHQTIEDMALMRSVPNMRVYAPCDAAQAYAIVKDVAEIKGPCYVRLGRSTVEDVYASSEEAYRPGKGNVLKNGKKVAVIACGLLVQEALKACEALKEEGIEITVIDMPCIKPLDEETILEAAKNHDILITAEEHSVIGGLGSAVADLCVRKHPIRIEMIGMQDTFGESGTPAGLLHKYKMDADAIVEKVKEVY
jgi:transketolase